MIEVELCKFSLYATCIFVLIPHLILLAILLKKGENLFFRETNKSFQIRKRRKPKWLAKPSENGVKDGNCMTDINPSNVTLTVCPVLRVEG